MYAFSVEKNNFCNLLIVYGVTICTYMHAPMTIESLVTVQCS